MANVDEAHEECTTRACRYQALCEEIAELREKLEGHALNRELNRVQLQRNDAQQRLRNCERQVDQAIALLLEGSEILRARGEKITATGMRELAEDLGKWPTLPKEDGKLVWAKLDSPSYEDSPVNPDPGRYTLARFIYDD